MKKVLVLCNLPQRDFVVDNILCEHLKRMGADTRLAEMLPSNRFHILGFKPDVVVLPEIRSEYTVALSLQCREWGVQVVSRRCEGGCSHAAWDAMTGDERMTAIGSWPYKCDLELVWGPQFKEILLANGYGTDEKIKVCGAFPFDVYFIPELKQPRKLGGKPKVMLATGWPMCDRGHEYCVPEAPHGSTIHKLAHDRHVKGRKEWLKAIDELLKRFGGQYDFMLRMQTGELPSSYYNVLGDRIQFEQPEPPIEGFRKVDIVVHAGSTLGIEAHFFGIPAISYMGHLNETPGYEPAKVSPCAETVDELAALIEAVEIGKSNANIDSIEKSIEEFYGKIDGSSCGAAADAIMSLPEQKLLIPDEWPGPTREYPTPGVSAVMETWQCSCCLKPAYTFLRQTDMIKCPNCGISLIRQLPAGEQELCQRLYGAVQKPV